MTVSSPLSVASMPSFDKSGLDPTQISLNRLQQLVALLDSSLRLPNSPRAFMIYLAGLAIVFAGAFMHVLVAAQLMQAEFTLTQLEAEYRALEQQNGDIIFQIARDTNLARLKARVVADGYVAVQEREYVFVPAESLANESVADAEVASSLNTNDPTQPALAAASTATHTNRNQPDLNMGQFARWEEFWNSTWRSATGTGASITANTTANSTANTAVNPIGNIGSTAAQMPEAVSDFWSGWWEQATAQGAKLLNQFRGQ